MTLNFVFLIILLFIGIIFFSIRQYIRGFSKEYSSDHYVTSYSGSSVLRGDIRAFKKYYRINSNFIIKLERETFITKSLKKLGLVKEFQVQDDLFDNRFFILSDDLSTCSNLAKNSILIIKLNKLYDRLEKEGLKFKYIKCNLGHLSVSISMKNIDIDTDDEEYEKYLENLLDEHLLPIKEILQDPFMVSKPQKYDKEYKSIKKVSKFLFGLSIILLLYIVMRMSGNEYFYLELLPIVYTSLFVSTLSLLAYLSYIVKKFKASSNFHEVLIWPSISIFLAMVFSSYLFIYFENIFLDKSNDKHYSSKILKKIYKHGSNKRKRVEYIFVFKDPMDKTKEIKMNVYKKEYDSKKVYDDFDMNIKDGYFGFRWLD